MVGFGLVGFGLGPGLWLGLGLCLGLGLGLCSGRGWGSVSGVELHGRAAERAHRAEIEGRCRGDLEEI